MKYYGGNELKSCSTEDYKSKGETIIKRKWTIGWKVIVYPFILVTWIVVYALRQMQEE